jgi:hypothetical protein
METDEFCLQFDKELVILVTPVRQILFLPVLLILIHTKFFKNIKHWEILQIKRLQHFFDKKCYLSDIYFIFMKDWQAPREAFRENTQLFKA